jgi:hypothetical protein
MSFRPCGLALAWGVFVGVPPGLASAQETVHMASVSGRVTDRSGAVIAGAQITARQTETNLTATTETDGGGRFRFPYLKVGPYELSVRQAGFADATRRLTLTVGAAFEVPVSLAVGTLETGVTVSAEAVVLESARSQIAGTVSQAEVRNLPLNGRNFLDLALLVPGVSPPNVGGTQLFAETSADVGAGVSVGSQRNFSNNFIVDGLSANDDAAGLSGIPYGVDAVDQFQVVTSGGQAELGRALGGYVNVLTKSGTNAWHGTAYDYARDRRFNAANALSGTTLPMNQAQFGGSLGGPIRRDRTFYFSNVEQRRLDQTGFVTISDANVAAINARLAAVGYQGAPITTGVYPNPVHSTNLLGKVDHQFNGKDQFGVRYSLYDVNSSNSRGAGALSAPSASAGLDNFDQTVAFSNTLTLSARTVNETRAQIAYSHLKAPPTDGIGPAVSIAGVASFGTLSSSPTARVNTLYQVVDNLSHQAGAHALRVGVDVLYTDDTITFPRSIRGAYTFSSLANFLSGTYNNSGFTQTFGTTVMAQTNPNVGVYAQDEWKASPRLTVNAGLRYDLQFLETIHTDTNDVSPRLGFAWSPFESRRTVVRGSAGLFYDRVPLRALANALLSAGNTSDLANLRQVSLGLSPSQAGAPAFPDILAGPVPAVTLLNLTTMNPNMQNAYSRQASVEMERQLGQHSTISVGYQHVGGKEPDRPGESERAHVRGGRHEQRVPPEPELREQQPVFAAGPLHLPRDARRLCPAAHPLGELPCQLLAVEGDERRGRELLQLADRSDGHLEGLGPVRRRPAAPPRALRIRQRPAGHSAEQHGAVVLASAAEHHVRSDDPAGDRRQAHRERRLHRAEYRRGAGLVQHESASQPRVHHQARSPGGRTDRGLQPDQPGQPACLERELRVRGVPREPLSTFGQRTAVGEPRSVQFAVRLRF